ncbi:EVE domain-containing protein [Ephemeroptericola cinctiostellae]|nr:EVE domain-containing protein [Ephemeroptericola cinctiostellae]
MMVSRYWIGVVSQSHVQRGVAGGFAQLCHGKAAPLKRMKVDDGLIYYSPKTDMSDGLPLQQFTAIGRVVGEAAYEFAMSESFVPFRRDIAYLPAQPTAIQPLLPHLSFIKDIKHWGYPFRTGHFEICRDDFLCIAAAMCAHWEE